MQYNTDKQHNGFLDFYRKFFADYKLGGQQVRLNYDDKITYSYIVR